MLKLTPARREKLADILYGQILEQIVTEQLKEGNRLPAHLTDFTAISDVAGLLRAFEARIALEPVIARLAAERATDRQLRVLHEAYVALESSEDGLEEDFAFHRAIAEAMGNEIFPFLLDSMHDLVLGGMNVVRRLSRLGSQARRERVIAEHRQIAEAIASRDGRSAEVLMHYHLLQARDRTTNYQRHP